MLRVSDYLTDQQIFRSEDAPLNPEVTVILPTYARYKTGLLERAIKSVLDQSITDFEFIIVDDGSSDGTQGYVRDLQKQDSRIVYIRHDKNSGLPALRVNEGIELARGKYIAFQFDDDSWRDNFLKTLLDAIKQHHTQDIMVFGKTLLQGYSYEPTEFPDKAMISHERIIQTNKIPNNSVLISKTVFDTCGMYDPHIGMRRLCDWDLWIRFIKNIPIIPIDEVISDVYSEREGAIGLTIPLDWPLFRSLNAVERNHLLTPQTWRDYSVDSLVVGNTQLSGPIAYRLYTTQIFPYYLKFRHHHSSIEGFKSSIPFKQKAVNLTSSKYREEDESIFWNYNNLDTDQHTHKLVFHPFQELTLQLPYETNALMLTHEYNAPIIPLIDLSYELGQTIAIYLNEDSAQQFEQNANLLKTVANIDAIWHTVNELPPTLRENNPRTIPVLNSVKAELLPNKLRKIDDRGIIKIAYFGHSNNHQEVHALWSAFERIAREFPNQIVFEFGGLEVSKLPKLSAPVTYHPFTDNYAIYLNLLRENSFDILVTADSPTNTTQSLTKYFEVAIAGALGIFPDIPVYNSLPTGETCLKAEDTEQSWYDALKTAITMSYEERLQLQQACVDHVQENYTDVALYDLYLAAWQATEIHNLTRKNRLINRRPCIMHVIHSPYLAGAELIQWGYLDISLKYGFDAILVMPINDFNNDEKALAIIKERCAVRNIELILVPFSFFITPIEFDEARFGEERNRIVQLLEEKKPALVNSTTIIPAFGAACKALSIPHVCSLYAIPDSFTPDYNINKYQNHCDALQADSLKYTHQWEHYLGVRGHCNRSAVDIRFFEAGRKRFNSSTHQTVENPLTIAMFGTLQPRKGQLEAIKAIGQLAQQNINIHLRLYGYSHFLPDYQAECEKQIEQDKTNHLISFHGFHSDIPSLFQEIDIALIASTAPDAESLPNTVKEAMAAGVLVVSTPAGGVSELIINGVTGVLCEGFTVEDIVKGIQKAYEFPLEKRLAMLKQARRVALSDFHPNRAAYDLFTIYRHALGSHNQSSENNSDLSSVSSDISFLTSLPSTVSRKRSTNISYVNLPAIYSLPIYKHIKFTVEPEKSGWNGLGIIIGTHQQQPQGEMRFRIKSPSGEVIRDVKVSLSETMDNNWLSVTFKNIVNSQNIQFTVEVTLIATSPQTIISIYQSKPTPHKHWQRALRKLRIIDFHRTSISHYLSYSD